MNLHKPTIVFHGPAATHDMACAVCHNKHAVYCLNTGTFSPCWECQEAGWILHRATSWLSRWAAGHLTRMKHKREQRP